MITKAEKTGEACLPLVSRRKLYITKFSYSFVCEIDRCSEHDCMYLFMVYLIWRDAVYIEVQRRGNPYILFISFHFISAPWQRQIQS